MENLLIYILKGAGILSIFYLLYLLLLRKETNFDLNRKFLLGGLFTTAVLPAIYFTKTVFVPAAEPLYFAVSNFQEMPQTEKVIPFDWWSFFGKVYLVITALFVLHFLFQLFSVLWLIYSNKSEKKQQFTYIQISESKLPFSFFSYIIFDPSNHSAKDLKMILAHEQAHAKQYHSVDILLANLSQCIFWFNPLAWFYKKSVEQNLEFLADREAISSEEEIKDYQHALVKVSVADLHPALTNHFYQSFIKKRILMLNNKSSNAHSGWKAGLVLPILFAFMLAFNVKTEAKVLENEAEEIPLQESVVNVETEVLITKKTTKEELDEIKETLKEYDIKADFSNLNFKNGNITSIRMEYEDEKTGNKGHIEKTDDQGISSFSFYFNDKGEIGTRGQNTQVSHQKNLSKKVKNIPSANTAELGDNPLYVINGETYTARKLRGKYIVLESPVQFLNAEKAVTKYGDKAEGGAVIVPKGSIIRDMNKEMKKLKSNTSFSKKFISIGDNGQPNLLNLDKNNSQNSLTVFNFDDNNEPVTIQGKAGSIVFVGSDANNEPVKTYTVQGRATLGDSAYFKKRKIVWNSDSDKKGTGYITKKMNDSTPLFIGISQNNQNVAAYQGGSSDQEVILQNPKPIYVVDGEVIEDIDLKSISPEDIAAINVLKDGLAIKKYGKKAKNGVIIIHTKGSGYVVKDSRKDAILFLFNSKNSDADMENLKDEVKKATGVEIEFTSVKRNDKGLISHIKISGKKDGRKASATWEVEEGIPTIKIGLSRDGHVIISSSYSE